jgi:hypothetical protein
VRPFVYRVGGADVNLFEFDETREQFHEDYFLEIKAEYMISATNDGCYWFNNGAQFSTSFESNQGVNHKE